MNFGLTAHARRRMSERGLSRRIVRETLEHPDSLVSIFDGQKAFKTFHEGVAVVVYVRRNRRIVVLTVYWKQEEQP